MIELATISSPTWSDALWRLLTLQDYNARVVLGGTALLGMVSGLIGTFMLLRKRALVGDALSHATYPGICLAFMLVATLGGNTRDLFPLLAGAAVTGLLATGCLVLIRRFSRVKEDAALAVVLGVFFGAGVVLNDLINSGQFGGGAGILTFIQGKPAAMLAGDAWLVGGSLVVTLALLAVLYKEFKLLCFDGGYARTLGLPVVLLDALLMTLVTLVLVVGLQAVGLILMIAMLIIPPAAARFWTDSLPVTLTIAATVGALSGLIGSGISALAPDLPAGAIIVLTAALLFLASMIFGTSRGLIIRRIRQRRLVRRVDRDNLLRSLYEAREPEGGRGEVKLTHLLAVRSWSPLRLQRTLARAARAGLVARHDTSAELTEAGLHEAQRVTRNHRLWEMYMITHADVAANHVDRGADLIEHVLGEPIVRKLEAALYARASG